ncbi:MAG TPA: vitamin K epoxide reductase family protein [Candidatus Saccharimonadales bacterium]|nr:vitamin K epoxide reductase family protein [Candidatus Saccharimonadales bacterium]
MFSWFKRNKNSNANHWIFGTMLVAGVLGLLSAFGLSVERVIQLTNPDAVLICDVNAIFNCGTVMQTWQAKLFGFPNSFIGLMGFSVVITVAVAGLSGVKFPKRFMQAAQICYGLGLIFAYWLFFQSVFVIQVLCPLCLVVTVSTTILFETLLRYNLRENNLNLPKDLHKKVLGWLQKDYDKLLVAGWLALMVAIVLVKFPGIF